ncbi:MAG: DoxX family protein [Flavobacteriales bacterium]|nr:DoxX family protein [Flavobacteriales bacterium]
MIFVDYGFPSWIVIPLAIIKILGIIAVISKLSKVLMEWAYAGFFFDAALALCTHYVAGDGGYLISAIAIVSIIVSRVMLPKAFPKFAG